MDTLEKTFNTFKIELEKDQAQRKELKEALSEWEESCRTLQALLLRVHQSFASRAAYSNLNL